MGTTSRMKWFVNFIFVYKKIMAEVCLGQICWKLCSSNHIHLSIHLICRSMNHYNDILMLVSLNPQTTNILSPTVSFLVGLKDFSLFLNFNNLTYKQLKVLPTKIFWKGALVLNFTLWFNIQVIIRVFRLWQIRINLGCFENISEIRSPKWYKIVEGKQFEKFPVSFILFTSGKLQLRFVSFCIASLS